MSNVEQCLKQVDNYLCSISPHTILLQGEADAVLEQQGVFFRKDPTYLTFAEKNNHILKETKGIAEILLSQWLRNFHSSIARLQNYLSIHSAIITNMAKDASRQQWIDSLLLLQSTARIYKKDIMQLNNTISALTEKVSSLTFASSQTVKNFNEAINGDNGLLAVLDNKLRQINIAIDGTFAGILAGNLLIIGGFILIFIASVASRKAWTKEVWVGSIMGEAVPIEYYLKWEYVAFGVLIAGVGTANSIAGLFAINQMFAKKNKLLFKKSEIKTEVKLALSVNGFCEKIERKMRSISDYLNKIDESWHNLTSSLKKIEDNLRDGKVSTDKLYVSFRSTMHSIDTGLQNINIIKNKISGIEIITDKKGQPIGDILLRNISA